MRQSLSANPAASAASVSNNPSWEPSNVGDVIDFTYVGPKVAKDVPSKFGGAKRDVLLIEAAEVMLNGAEVQDQAQVYDIWTNPLLQIKWEKLGVAPGTQCAIKFVSVSPEFNNSKNYDIFVGTQSPTWKPGAPAAAPVQAAGGLPIEQAFGLAPAAATAPAPAAPAATSPWDAPVTPNEYDQKISALLAGKLAATAENYKTMAVALSGGLQYTPDNAKAIHDALVAKLRA